MILTCPNCDTQYVVKDGAIPPGGRQVRCASCKHSWHQDPDENVEPEAVDQQSQPAALPEDPVEAIDAEYVSSAEQQEQVRDEDESFTEAAMIEPRSGPELEERAYEEAVIEGVADPVAGQPGFTEAPVFESAAASPPEAVQEDWREPPVAEAADDEFSPFRAAAEPEAKRRSPIVTILIVALVVAVAAAAFWFLAPPAWKAALGLGGASASPLAFVATHVDRQQLEPQGSGELLTLTGRIINPTRDEQAVPPLKAELRDTAGKVIYSWTIAPPAARLGPGGSATFNSAEVNVPAGGAEVTISADAPRA